MLTSSGRRHTKILLDDPIQDRTPGAVYDPEYVWGALQPATPGAFDELKVSVMVTIPFHPQVNTNTRIRYSQHGIDHQLFVRGVQDQDLLGRELVLYCEEVLTP